MAREHIREMSLDERRFLEDLLKSAPGRLGRIKMGIGNAIVLWAATMLALVLVWLAVAWVVRKLTGTDMGWDGPWALWILSIGGIGCAVYSIISTERWLRGTADLPRQLRAEITGNRVIEEHYAFSGAMRMQEPEHGGLIYFLHDHDGRVLVLYDHESQDFGVQDEDPLSSSFEPKDHLIMVRAPESRIVIDKRFTGEILDPGEPLEITVSPLAWPEQDELCDVPWSDLERRFASHA